MGAASDAHYLVGREVRAAIKRVDGIMPEDLPTPEKSISQIEREQLNKLKNRLCLTNDLTMARGEKIERYYICPIQ